MAKHKITLNASVVGDPDANVEIMFNFDYYKYLN